MSDPGKGKSKDDATCKLSKGNAKRLALFQQLPNISMFGLDLFYVYLPGKVLFIFL